MGLDNLYSKITEKFDTKLGQTGLLVELPDELRDFLSKLYSHDSLPVRLTATLINAIYTEKRESFLMSKNLMAKLVEVDSKNINRKTLNDVEYKTFAALVIQKGIIEIISNSEEKSAENPNGLAGTWVLADRDARKIMERYWPQELDEHGLPYISDEEMHEQWINGGHAEFFYENWLNKQVELERELENCAETAAREKNDGAPHGENPSQEERTKKQIKFY